MKRLILDLDGTLTIESDLPYAEKLVNPEVLAACKEYKSKGWEVVIATSRNMRTYEGNVGKITANTGPIIIE